MFADVDGPRGRIQLFVLMLDCPLDASAVRQAQVRQLAAFIEEVTRRHDLGVVCGDFNAGPDSDELRMLTGRTDTAAPGLVFYDSWELAGDPGRAPSATPHTARLLGAIRAPERLQLSDHYGVLADLRY